MIFFVEANFASNSNAIFYECADEDMSSHEVDFVTL